MTKREHLVLMHILRVGELLEKFLMASVAC